MEGGRRILIADDDPDLLDLIQLDLNRRGYEVFAASSGTEALHIAKSEHIDLALLDVMMPGVDGYHVAQELTSTLGPACPKIIIITSRDVSREQGIAVMSGALAAIQKPINLGLLAARIEEILGPQK